MSNFGSKQGFPVQKIMFKTNAWDNVLGHESYTGAWLEQYGGKHGSSQMSVVHVDV